MPVRNTELLLLKARIQRAIASGNLRALKPDEVRSDTEDMEAEIPTQAYQPYPSRNDANSSATASSTLAPVPAPMAKTSPSGTTNQESTKMQIITAAGKLCQNEMVIRQWPLACISKHHGPEETETYYFKELLKLELHVNPATCIEEAVETWRQRKLDLNMVDGAPAISGIIPQTAMYSQRKWPTTYNGMALVDLDILETSISPIALNEKLRIAVECMKEAQTDFGDLIRCCGGIPVPIVRAVWSEQVIHARQDKTPIVSRAQYCFPYVQTGARTPIYTPIYKYNGPNREQALKEPPHPEALDSRGVFLPQMDRWFYWNGPLEIFEEVRPSPWTATSPFVANPYTNEEAPGGTVRKLALDRHLSDTSPANSTKRRRTESCFND